MGLAASALGGSGCSPRLTMTITSRASATIKEAPAKYEWKRLDSVNSEKAFTVSSAIQQMIETILMFTDILIPLRPEPVYAERKAWRGKNRGVSLDYRLRRPSWPGRKPSLCSISNARLLRRAGSSARQLLP